MKTAKVLSTTTNCLRMYRLWKREKKRRRKYMYVYILTWIMVHSDEPSTNMPNRGQLVYSISNPLLQTNKREKCGQVLPTSTGSKKIVQDYDRTVRAGLWWACGKLKGARRIAWICHELWSTAINLEKPTHGIHALPVAPRRRVFTTCCITIVFVV